MQTIADQLGDDRPGAKVYDFSNTRRTRRLANIQVMERVVRFLQTGDRHHLPPGLRGEADGIMALFAADQLALALGDPPWPGGAARPYPGPGASVSELMRALVGDEMADADSGLEA